MTCQSFIHSSSTTYNILLFTLNIVDQNIDPLPLEKTPERQPHAKVVTELAAKALLDKNIPLVESGSQIQWRCGYPAVLLVQMEHPSIQKFSYGALLTS
jgi:hypothetical protein